MQTYVWGQLALKPTFCGCSDDELYELPLLQERCLNLMIYKKGMGPLCSKLVSSCVFG